MSKLPTDAEVARLVTSITSTMLGMDFLPAIGVEPGSDLFARVFGLPTLGTETLTVALSCGEATGTAMSSAMFGCDAAEVDSQMIEDTLSELLNMTSGLVKGIVAPNQRLGLPKIVDPATFAQTKSAGAWHTFFLRSGELEISLCISQKTQLDEVLWLCG